MTTYITEQRSPEGNQPHGANRLTRWPLMLVFILAFLAIPLFGFAASQIRVAVYVDQGACGDKTIALFRALAGAGFKPLGVETNDIINGRLNSTNFDVFVLPSGETASSADYSDYEYFGNYQIASMVKKFLNNGGGVVGIEAGASYLSSLLNVVKYNATYPKAGLQNFTIADTSFGKGSQAAYMSAGGGYFGSSSATVTVANDTQGRPALVRSTYGKGRIVLSSFDPELRGDSELDWTIWDNWDAGNSHPNSEGAWILLGRMINFAASGVATAPKISSTNPAGARVAMISTHNSNGGAAASLQPAFARAIEYAGHIPLAIRLKDVRDGRLTNKDFKVVAFPGGTVAGYSYELIGYESAILDFVRYGGSYYGVCGGSYYASKIMMWDGSRYYDAPLLGLFKGTDTGPLTEIATWPNWATTPVRISDPVIGDLGTQQQMYYGGGWKSLVSGVDSVSYYTTSAHSGAANGIRFTYGNGRVFLNGTHPEARFDTDEDWLYWDKWTTTTSTTAGQYASWMSYVQPYLSYIPYYKSATSKSQKVTGTDNTWTYVQAIFNKWLVH